ncbi:ATP-binding protein [Marinimicrobium sp. ARAG 43.8]|uniref:sensor histidine kinase n=1 Tax=Marinimicrobium sp. ARAG 43.8 TaxID=3418719 RepID=UPI003CF7CCC6
MAKPRRLSLYQQWLLIALITLVPILSLIAYASWAFYQQMHVQRMLGQRAEELNSLQTELDSQIRDLERFARQYRLLRDVSFLEPYREQYRAVQEGHVAIRRFLHRESSQNIPLVANPQQRLLRDQINQLQTVLGALTETELIAVEDTVFSTHMVSLSRARSALTEAIANYTNALSARGEIALQSILWRLSLLGIISIPVTLTLLGLGFWQMIKPIRRLSMAIRNLGHGDWDTPIRVSGPKDFQVLGERLEWMRGQLLAADQQKQVFLRHVSHELKTPLSAIVEAGSLLQDEVPGPINPRQRSVLRILMENSQSLQELIQQLLNYNVITHNVAGSPQLVNMTALCERIIARLSQPNLRHQVTWEYSGEVDQLQGDPQLLEMVVSNLMSNAYHYSPGGGVVRIAWGMEGGFAWLSVTDEGPGIAEDDRETIFLPFAQGAVRRSGAVHGSGVGLAIVKESVDRLGGELQLTSEVGVGSCFLLRYPVGGNNYPDDSNVENV